MRWPAAIEPLSLRTHPLIFSSIMLPPQLLSVSAESTDQLPKRRLYRHGFWNSGQSGKQWVGGRVGISCSKQARAKSARGLQSRAVWLRSPWQAGQGSVPIRGSMYYSFSSSKFNIPPIFLYVTKGSWKNRRKTKDLFRRHRTHMVNDNSLLEHDSQTNKIFPQS